MLGAGAGIFTIPILGPAGPLICAGIGFGVPGAATGIYQNRKLRSENSAAWSLAAIDALRQALPNEKVEKSLLRLMLKPGGDLKGNYQVQNAAARALSRLAK